jgi:ABC-2 type transport system ATP-binding protein
MTSLPARAEPDSASPAIEAHGVTKSFGTTKALDGVDLVADAGRVLALLGPNGAGKTTLVRILTTLLAADSGWAKVAGLDVVKDAVELRRLIGVTGQFAAIDLLLTGRENLEMVGELSQISHPEARRRADELLEQFDLVDAADRQAKTYSGGMRRRLDLAASLIANPPVLVLDEPTTGLDPRTRTDVWAAVDRLVEGGTTVLLTTQYLEEADRLAHHIVVIDQGHVVAEGTADELKDRLGGDVVDVQLSRPDEIDTAFAALELRDAGAIDRERQRLTLPAPDGVATLRVALDRLDGVGVGVDDIGLRRPSLDDVFLALTGHGVSSDDSGSPDSTRAGKRQRRRPRP